MYCKKCGKKIKDNETFCMYCGQDKDDVVLTGNEKKDAVRKIDYQTIGGMCIIISLILPPIGLIMSIIYLCTMKNNTTMEKKEEGKKRLIISIIISLAWIFIPMILGMIHIIASLIKLG